MLVTLMGERVKRLSLHMNLSFLFVMHVMRVMHVMHVMHVVEYIMVCLFRFS